MLAPGGVVAWIGSTLSQIPKTRMSTIPETISGMTVADRPTTLMMRSPPLADVQRGHDAPEDAQRVRR